MQSSNDSYALTFTFSGGIEVDALTVVDTIRNLVSISTETTKSEYPETTLALSIRAPKQGSLMFDFVVAAKQAFQTLTSENIKTAQSVVDIIISMFQIKKFLKGKKAKSTSDVENSIVIENADGSKITVPKGAALVISNSNIDLYINKIIESADKSTGVTGVSISSPHKEVSIPREEFAECCVSPSVQEQNFTYIRHNEILYVKSAEFQGSAQWKFTADKTISADIQDTEFLRRIHSGDIAISSKTYLVADVKVSIPLKIDGTPNEAKVKYSVIKVNQIIEPNDKNQLNF